MTGEVVLHTENLSKRYKQRWAVNGLTLTVRRGEVFGFLGPNGAGKSTTIRMLLSLVTPTAGNVQLFGMPLRGRRNEALARVGGLVERPDFYLYLTARRNLEIVAALKGGTPHIDEVLSIVGLAERAGDKVKSYSHGMKQRLGIAQALLGWPEFIILDEPTSGLDPQGIKEVRELILRLSTERGITILLSSHLLHEIEQVASTMAIVNRGELLVQGSVRELLHAGGNIIRVDARPQENALPVIRALGFVQSAEIRDDQISVVMPVEQCAALNEALVRAGIAVHALAPKRSLEEYFLALTEGSSDVSPRTGGDA